MNIKIVGSLLLVFNCLFGGKIVVDSPKKITPEWESKVLGIKYGVTTLDNAVNEMVAGMIDEVFDKDFIKRVKTEIEKHPAGKGEYIEYWPNGTLKARIPYKDGKAHGHLHGWYENGTDAFKGFFQKGVKQGIHITFYHCNYEGNREVARLVTFTENGKLDGKYTLFHPNGCIWIATVYKNNLLTGPLRAWHNNGEQFLSTLYKNGVLQTALPKNGPPPKSLDTKYVDEVIGRFIKIAQHEFGITPYATGAKMAYDVEAINVDFQVRKKGTVEEARKLMVQLKERFAEVVNAHEKLRPYLREYPFTPERAHIHLSFCNNQGIRNQDGSINFVLVGSNKNIYYFSSNILTPNKDKELQEPYEEAVKIVHGEKK